MGFLTRTVKSTRVLIQRYWPILLALSIFFVTTVILLSRLLDRNGGKFVYTLDDPYIHMAIAKNVVQHGVWGVTPYGFSSSSSSPLWTLCLTAFYALFGVSELSPYFLNLIFAVFTLGLAYIFLRGHLPKWVIFMALLGLIFAPPLVPMVFSGMEHTAHLFFTLLTVSLAAKVLLEENSSPALQRGLLISAFLLTSVRYEGLFLLLILGALFACRKRWLFTLYLVGSGMLPLMVYGIWSVAQGWYFLPNPVILKGTSGNQAVVDFLQDVIVRGNPLTWEKVQQLEPALFINRINANPHILYLMIPSLFLLFIQWRRSWEPARVINIAFIGSMVLHMQFASMGWFYRYEAYAIGLGIYAIGHGMVNIFSWQGSEQDIVHRLIRVAGNFLLLIIFISPLGVRAVRSLEETPVASHNIYEQQYQMAIFLQQFYQGQVVAANDIGAINYYAEFHLVDLAGLATRESAAFKLQQNYSAQQVATVAEQYNTQIAMVYDSWFQIPIAWIKVGEWQITDNVVCGDSVVSFYAMEPRAELALIANLQSFASQLPGDVIQRDFYR